MGAQRAVSLPRLPVPCLAQLSHSVPAQPSRAGRVAAALRGLFSSAQVCLEEEECDQGNMLYTGQEAGPVVMNSFLSLSVASVFYSFSPNSSFFIVCFRTALKFSCALQGPCDVLPHSALEALASPTLLSRNMLPSSKGCVLRDLQRAAFPEPISKCHHPGVSCVHSRTECCPFFSEAGCKGRCEAWQTPPAAQPSPPHGAGEHSLQGRCDTLK